MPLKTDPLLSRSVMDSRIERARTIIRQEAEVVNRLADRLGDHFPQVVDAILNLGGRVVTAGMGKSGIIAKKISATFSSTGTQSIFLHPAEALHGDLGRVVPGDMLLTLSKSGETEEVLRLLAPVKAVGVSVVALTQSRESSLGRHADTVLELGPIEEVGPYQLAPSASTTAMLALGDALALVVQEDRDVGPEEFARYHPGGHLGRCLMKVGELMRTGERNPVVRASASVLAAIEVITRTPGRPGATSVADAGGTLLGLFTDGDLRRLLQGEPGPLGELKVDSVMTPDPHTISPDMFAMEALAYLHQHRVDQMPVVDGRGRLVGLLDVQDLVDLRIG
jgi:arabinose-5-phosphate isomerase